MGGFREDDRQVVDEGYATIPLVARKLDELSENRRRLDEAIGELILRLIPVKTPRTEANMAREDESDREPMGDLAARLDDEITCLYHMVIAVRRTTDELEI